jgi:hypothetical protein
MPYSFKNVKISLLENKEIVTLLVTKEYFMTDHQKIIFFFFKNCSKVFINYFLRFKNVFFIFLQQKTNLLSFESYKKTLKHLFY